MNKQQVLQALKAVHAQKGLPATAKDLGMPYSMVREHTTGARPVSNVCFQMYRLYFENKKLYVMVQKLLLEHES